MENKIQLLLPPHKPNYIMGTDFALEGSDLSITCIMSKEGDVITFHEIKSIKENVKKDSIKQWNKYYNW